MSECGAYLNLWPVSTSSFKLISTHRLASTLAGLPHCRLMFSLPNPSIPSVSFPYLFLTTPAGLSLEASHITHPSSPVIFPIQGSRGGTRAISIPGGAPGAVSFIPTES